MQKCSPEANASERAFLRPDRLTIKLLILFYYIKGRVKNTSFSHALHNVITYEIISFYKGTLVILTGLPAQHLMAILCDEHHDFPLG